MADYSNPNTRLTAGRYAWTATLTQSPLKHGSNAAKDRTGRYTPPPGATVKTLLNGIRTLHAQECGAPVANVVLVRYSLTEV
ncbi:hypothetical protein QBA57_21400 [Streptomyces scabiei]|uniref:hypothetical protein n=1 Tax=Streptomyces scabiei TaxID=1930 RepID=UPI001B303D5F|nr:MULTISPECIES: hypothetical protein [Streptomyces]MBP5884524.1 hypothetical protein [Streptomyces sp. LBUM 1487]MDX3034676.1 hypothetical protein [Streptomyces scabiei]QTU47618.1 hypothetical protein F3K20_24865 [Streptomyces sp. LBUM 1482]